MASRPKIETGNPKVVTPASSAYWAARLNERKHAEEALREACAELSKRVDQQAAQLDVLSQALRRESGERKRLEALLKRAHAYVQRADTEGSLAYGADLGAQLLEQERAEETARAEFVEMRRMVEMLAAELRGLEDTLRRETAARERSEAVLSRAQGELEQSIALHTAPKSVNEADESNEHQRAKEALRADLDKMNRMVEVQATQLCELRETQKREVAARARSEAVLQRRPAELGERISQSASRGTEATDLLIEWRESEKALWAFLIVLGQRIDKQNIELRSIEESLHRKVAELQRSEEALQRMQAELEWRFGEHAARLEAVGGALEGGNGASSTNCSGLHLNRQ